MLSTAHFEDLCTECSFAKSRYIVRLYAEPVDISLPIDELPEWVCILVMSVDGNKAHAEAAKGPISAKHITEINAKLKTLGVKTCVFERHKNGKIKRITRKIK